MNIQKMSRAFCRSCPHLRCDIVGVKDAANDAANDAEVFFLKSIDLHYEPLVFNIGRRILYVKIYCIERDNIRPFRRNFNFINHMYF
jgi:hypothetical protein